MTMGHLFNSITCIFTFTLAFIIDASSSAGALQMIPSIRPTAFTFVLPLPHRRMNSSHKLQLMNAAISQSHSRIMLGASPFSSNDKPKTKPPPLPKTDDPFLLLGLDSLNPTTDAKEIKRAFRKRAMQYHPDVILGPDSSKSERDEASKNFARINAAYEILTGGGRGSNSASATTTSGGGAKSSSNGYYDQQPPHRRQSSYSASSSQKSTNWEDFMPNYTEEDSKYDAGGDSFGSILSDLLTGAAGYAAGVAGRAGGGGVVGDFVEFLERNIDGFESGYDDDKSLSQLLLYGSFDDVASEMDETDILVTSLETKLNTVENELLEAQADLSVSMKLTEKLTIEEKIAELKARQKVAKGYLKKGKTRLIRLRERYKELMIDGRGGRGYGRRTKSDSTTSANSTSSSSRSRPDNQSREPAQPSSPSSRPTSFTPSPPSTKSWRNEGFTGSFGGRSSSNRQRQEDRKRSGSQAENGDEQYRQRSYDNASPTSASASSSAKSWRDEGFSGSYGRRSSGGSGKRRNYGSESNQSTSTVQQPWQQKQGDENIASQSTLPEPTSREYEYGPWVPPHRRTQSSSERATQDKKRLRELKIEDDFERLKKEMGM